MINSKPLAAVLCCAAVLALPGCRQVNPNTAAVNVLRDPHSTFFSRQEEALLDFQARRPKTSSGKFIIVQSILVSRPRLDHMLADGSAFKMFRPDVVILDSPEQIKASGAVQREAASAKNACGNEGNCPVFIPSWVVGEKLQAARQVLNALLSGDK